MSAHSPKKDRAIVRELLADRTIALVGLMGAGKSAVGRRAAAMLDLPFVDADTEIETAAKMTIAEIFAEYGEPEFRRLEVRVIERILDTGPQLLATGGGAWMSAETRELISAKGMSLWLRADLDLLMSRVTRKPTRPLLQQPDPRGVMQNLIDLRYPVYATADVIVDSRDTGKDEMANSVIAALANHLAPQAQATAPSETQA